MESPNLSGSSGSDLILMPSQLKPDVQEHLYSTRATWKSRRECIEGYFCFLMSFANGLQFGASIGKYGFLIFIPYIVWNIIVGIPAVLVEVMISRYVMSDIADAWNICPIAKGVLWILFGTTVLSINNNFIYLVYLMKYFFASFTNPLKWASCDAPWNTVTCYIAGKKTNAMNNCLRNHTESFCMSLSWETSGTQFWKYHIADKTSSIAYVSIVFCLLAAILLISIIIFKEIQSLEKTFIIMVLFPIILGGILAWVSFSTNEAIAGFEQIFTFNWKWLLHSQIWVESLENMLLFLGLGDLSLTFVSSHGAFADDIFADVVIISFGGFLFSMFYMFPILSVSAGSRVRPVINEKYHLQLFKDKEDVFISISDALIVYPLPNFVWAIMTYVNWFLITISAQAILVLAICDIFVGTKEFNFSSVLIIFLISSFFMTICCVFFSIEFMMDLGSVALVVIILFTVTWQFFYGTQKFNYDFFFMMGKPLPIFVKLSWVTLMLFTLLALLCKMLIGVPYKPYKYLCYFYVGAPVFIYLLGFTFEMATMQIKKQKVSQIFFANPDWGPKNSILKRSRLIMTSTNINREFMYRQELNKKPFTKQENFTDQNIVQLI